MTRKGQLSLLFIPAVPGLFLILTSGFELLPSIGIFNSKRLLESVALIGILGFTLANPAARTGLAWQLSSVPRWIAMSLLVLFALGLISALRFPHPGYGIADVSTLALMVLAMLIVAAVRQLTGENFDRLLLCTIAAIGVFVAWQELMGLLSGWIMGVEFSSSEMLIRFAHPRFYNQLQSWSMLLLAALPWVFPKRRNVKLWAVCLLGLQWCLLVMSGGRGSMVSLLAALLVVGLVTGNSRRSWAVIHAGGMFLGAVLYISILIGHHLLVPAGGDFVEQSVGRQLFHTTGRSHLWQLAVDDAVSHPLLGAGPMRFNCEGPAGFPAHPHSFPFRILSEWGIPSLLIVIVVSIFLGWRMFRYLIQEDRDPDHSIALKSMLVASVVAASIHACVSGLLIMPASQVMAILVCGWLLGMQQAAKCTSSTGKPTAMIMCIIALLGSLGILGFNVQELKEMDFRISKLADQPIAYPRYWQYGRVCQYSYK